jgi:hypothetical protein
MGHISEERIASEVDEPFDQAVQLFQLKVKVPISHLDFNRVIAEFVRHVYLNGIRLPRYLTFQEGLAEAVSLLEGDYQGIHTTGYDVAFQDASSSKMEGLELVLYCLAESIKKAERGKYVEWVFVDNVDPLDWEKKERLVSAYLKKYKDFLPSQLREIDPAQLVDHFHGLVFNHLSTNNLLLQIFGDKMKQPLVFIRQ